MNLAANLTATAARDGARTALVLGDERLSYLELDVASAKVAGMLRAHLVPPVIAAPDT